MKGSRTGFIIQLVELVVVVASAVGAWKSFIKAGLPGWACLVPIYNVYLVWQMSGRPILWFILLFVPFVNIIPMIDVAKAYGQGTGIGVAMAFGVGWLIVGFGDATYQGKKIDTAVAVPASKP